MNLNLTAERHDYAGESLYKLTVQEGDRRWDLFPIATGTPSTPWMTRDETYRAGIAAGFSIRTVENAVGRADAPYAMTRVIEVHVKVDGTRQGALRKVEEALERGGIAWESIEDLTGRL